MQPQYQEHDYDKKVAQAVGYYGRDRLQIPAAFMARHQITLVSWHLRTVLWQMFRRILDCVVATLMLFVVSPLLLVTALAIKLDSPGPVIFRQIRVGKRGKVFTLYKFRSMAVDAEQRKQELHQLNEADGPLFKIRQDPRVTRVGAIIRKLSIDELPQFVNVLKGDLNLVGPRPPVPDEVNRYEIDHLRRLEVTPGITGLPQVMGRSNLDFETWVELDRKYIAHQSLRMDLMILWKTVPAVLLRRGAY
jgi:lipopolysaccharide/colanic/teichoic acid biosynthesis glycosyltransferase